MSNMNVIIVADLRTRLINLHNELGKAETNYRSKPEIGTVELNEVLDRYGMVNLKGQLFFDDPNTEG